MEGRVVAIVNPASHSGRAREAWPHAEAELRRRLAGLEVRKTCAPGAAGALALECAEEEVELLVVAGGDGTLREVATALAERGPDHSPELGLLPLGSGCDFARALGIPTDIDAAVERIASSVSRPFDVGLIDYRAPGGADGHCAFVNIACCGMSGRLDEQLARQPRWLGSRARYLFAALRAILLETPEEIEVRVDGERRFQGPAALCAVANGRYFGAGMNVAPAAQPDDGALDVVVMPGEDRLGLLRQLPELYRGTHVTSPGAVTCRGSVVELIAEPDRVWLDTDGDTLGTLPARFEIRPGALKIR